MLTNKYDLPEAFVRAVEFNDYNAGKSDITVTQLIGPELPLMLKDIYEDEIEDDVSDRLWSLLGSAVHNVLERAAGASELVEKRMYREAGGWVIGGQFDNLDLLSGTLTDYKLTSVWSVIGETKQDWINQLNVLRWILEANNVQVNKLQIVAMLRDWSRTKALGDNDYPQSNVVVIDIPINPDVDTYVHDRVLGHQAARLLADNGYEENILECSPEERWEKPSKWAVMKKGLKRAVKLHNTEEGANKHAEELGSAAYVEFRQGERTRCEHYCQVAKYCHYYQKEANNA
jgi:hypothetical protein